LICHLPQDVLRWLLFVSWSSVRDEQKQQLGQVPPLISQQRVGGPARPLQDGSKLRMIGLDTLRCPQSPAQRSD
jgi:hypothetical protein